MKRIKKVSQTVPTYGQIVDGYSNSTTDSYSANYQNEHNIIVNPTTPITNERVWFAKGKNLFDKNNNIVTPGYLDANGNVVTTDATLSYQNYYIKVKPNTKYTISSNTSTIYRIAEYNSSYSFIQRVYNTGENTSYTITTSSNTQYIKMAGTLTTVLNSVQIEEGSTATTYENYVTPSINVNGDEIYNQNISNYSTTEQKVGTWIDGKPLYRKVIESTTFTTNFYPVSSNIKQFINQYGYVQRKDYTSIWQPIPSRIGNAMSISFLASTQDGGVQIDWGSSWQNDYANLFNKIVLIVEYTKTTD